MVENFTKGCEKKAAQNHLDTFVLAILAGMFIAFGGSSSNLAVHQIADPGIAKTVAGTIFPVGLMLIVAVAGELFTGDCMMVFGNFSGKYSVFKTIQKLAIVFCGNMVGSLIIMFLLYGAGQYNTGAGALGAYTIKVALGKINLSFGTAIASGILCNILVCAAVLIASRVENIAGKIFAVFFPIMAFVIGGFEHCVANMYFIPAGIACLGNDVYRQQAMELYGYTEEMLSALTIPNFLLHNLLPVTIGNMIGGMVFVALPLYYLSKRGNA